MPCQRFLEKDWREGVVKVREGRRAKMRLTRAGLAWECVAEEGQSGTEKVRSGE